MEKNISENIVQGGVEPRTAQAEGGQGLRVGRIYKVIVCREDKLSECFETTAEYLGGNQFDIDFELAPPEWWNFTWIVDDVLKEV